MQNKKNIDAGKDMHDNIRRGAGKSRPVSYGNKHEVGIEDRRGAAERLRSSGRGVRDGNRSSERSGVHRVQQNKPNQIRGGMKKISWWKVTSFWKWPWYKWFFRKNR